METNRIEYKRRITADLEKEVVEQLGSGVPRILRSYSKDCFIFGDSYTRMVFKFDIYKESSQKIVSILKENPHTTTEELGEILGISRRAVAKQIAKLKQQGIINVSVRQKADTGK